MKFRLYRLAIHCGTKTVSSFQLAYKETALNGYELRVMYSFTVILYCL